MPINLQVGSSNTNKPPYLGYAVLIIIAAGLIVSLWSGIGTFYSNGQPIILTSSLKVLITAAILILLGLYSLFFFHQRKKDNDVAHDQYSESGVDKVAETAYKAGGAWYKIRAVLAGLGALVALGVSLYFLYMGIVTPEGNSYFIFSGVVLVVALVAAINARLYWKKSKALSDGRLY